MSVEEKIGQLNGTLKTFMDNYVRDREEDHNERERFRNEIKSAIADAFGKASATDTDHEVRIKLLEKAKIQDDVPRSWLKEVLKFLAQCLAAGGALGIIAAAINHLVEWARARGH